MTTCAHKDCTKPSTHKATWFYGVDTDHWCTDHIAPIYTDEWATTGRLKITKEDQ